MHTFKMYTFKTKYVPSTNKWHRHSHDDGFCGQWRAAGFLSRGPA